MNKARAEEARKLREAYENLSQEELQEFEQQRRIEALAKEIHFELFLEEYDHMMDSISDAKDRRRGINPMSADYTAKVNARREELAISTLGTNGMPIDNSSWDVASAEALRRLK
ncbi:MULTISPECIES: hypothetical protein [unclassified Marinobacter]|uniref:hypothetical protein n=1 Tax=unclassified Marinobacter TaxID=83889 RepID=UPI001927E844|nr:MULTISPECIES: hypothetical protein [unclassified Marinobacter]MBL3824121.1 hypothetical protein [Marinobacter sp. MC3]MBL3892787.1 hypothetical protein [Marinobacter sp. MW3]